MTPTQALRLIQDALQCYADDCTSDEDHLEQLETAWTLVSSTIKMLDEARKANNVTIH